MAKRLAAVRPTRASSSWATPVSWRRSRPAQCSATSSAPTFPASSCCAASIASVAASRRRWPRPSRPATPTRSSPPCAPHPDDVAWIELDPVADPSQRGARPPLRRAVVATARTVVAAAQVGNGTGALAALRSIQVLCAHRRGPAGGALARGDRALAARRDPGYGAGPGTPAVRSSSPRTTTRSASTTATPVSSSTRVTACSERCSTAATASSRCAPPASRRSSRSMP